MMRVPVPSNTAVSLAATPLTAVTYRIIHSWVPRQTWDAGQFRRATRKLRADSVRLGSFRGTLSPIDFTGGVGWGAILGN